MPQAHSSKSSNGRQKRVTAAARDVTRTKSIAQKLAKVAPDEDPARVAGAIAIFATETIKRSANNLMEARAYLDGLRAGIDGLLKNAFPEGGQKEAKGDHDA
ncbi:MAG: hypothetical protein E6G97_00760 [Alphaproteobacteria bacterium]|nr:MAG: hypothetical protein E6G97_00760 [Alphaproteobacteria bacterium]